MHEASLVQGLLDLTRHAVSEFHKANPDKPAPKIRQVICEAGLLACFEPQTLQACFEIFTEDTEAEGAELIINTVPLDCICNSCGKEFKLHKRHFICPLCGSGQINFKGGNGLVLQAINLDCGEDND